MIAVAGGMVWLTSDPAFSVVPSTVSISGAHYTDPADIRAAMRLVGGVRPATVVISTRSMEAAIEKLPAVAGAEVRAVLPGTLTVSITERQPMLEWRIGDDAWLLDETGTAFAPVSRASADEQGDGATGTMLPAVDDLRADATMAAGDRLDAVDLEAVRTLGNVTPDLLDSSAPALFLSLAEGEGWVLTAPDHWRAVFGHYTQTLLPASRIPAQVQCLAALLADSERAVEVVTLAVSTDRCGTVVDGPPEPTLRPRKTPRPEPTKRPGRTPAP